MGANCRWNSQYTYAVHSFTSGVLSRNPPRNDHNGQPSDGKTLSDLLNLCCRPVPYRCESFKNKTNTAVIFWMYHNLSQKKRFINFISLFYNTFALFTSFLSDCENVSAGPLYFLHYRGLYYTQCFEIDVLRQV